MNKKKRNLFTLISILIVTIIVLLGMVIFWNSKLTQQEKNNPTQQTSSEEELKKCPYLDKEQMKKIVDRYYVGEEALQKLARMPADYVFKLWKKGYHPLDILELESWKLSEADIPDLNAEKRIGVIGELFIVHNIEMIVDEVKKKEWKKLDEKIKEEKRYLGGVKNLVVIAKKVPFGQGKIFIDKGYYWAPSTLEGKQTGDYIKKIINFALKMEGLNISQYRIYVISALGIEYLGRERYCAGKATGGKSAGSAFYLALLSSLYQKLIAKNVASTGALSLTTKRVNKGKINNQEFEIIPGTNLPVGGLNWKIPASLERGYNHLVLSKYQSNPHLLSEYQRPGKWTGQWDDNQNKIYHPEGWRKPAEDYQEMVLPEVKEKLKIHFAKDINELKELLLTRNFIWR